MNLRRILCAATLAATVTGLAACTSGGLAVSQTPPPSAPLSGGPIPSSGAPTSASACDVLSSTDVQSTLGESVTATNPLPGVSGTAGQLQGCVLTTDGPPLAPDATAALKALAATVVGDAANGIDLSTGGIAVVQASTPLTVIASPTALPAGVTAVPGIGQQAYVAALTTGGGLAFAQLTPNSAVLVLDIEGKQVTTDQLTALLTAAAS